MSLKVIALLFAVLLAANALVINKHEDGDSASNWDDDEDFSQVEISEYGQDDEGEPALSAESQAKITEFMLNDDGIRAELIANAVAETPELSWLSEISADNQKAVLRIFMKYSEDPEADPSALITELNAIEEVQPHIAAWVGEEESHLRQHLRLALAHKWGGY